MQVHQQRQPFSQTLHVFTIAEGAVAADVKNGGKATGKRGITFSFIYGYRLPRHQGDSPPANSPPRNDLATNVLATKRSLLATNHQ